MRSRGTNNCSPGWIVWLIVSCSFRLGGSSLPEVSSTALSLHKLYTQHPPHDVSLYDILQVSPNATAAQIAQGYRRLSRNYHPDKQDPRKRRNKHQVEQQQQAWEHLQQAYTILQDDSTRLPYHQYGLTDPNLAVLLLLGPQPGSAHLWTKATKATPTLQNPKSQLALKELLQWMGYDLTTEGGARTSGRLHTAAHQEPHKHSPPPSPSFLRHKRIRLSAVRLIERLRPLVEESVDPGLLTHMWAKDCDRFKTLPLGAQIVRCLGRAYRHAGQEGLHALEKNRKNGGIATAIVKKKNGNHRILLLPLRKQWRQVKHVGSALWASGRAGVTEHVWTRQEERRRRQKQKQAAVTNALEYHGVGEQLGNADFLEEDNGWDDEEAMFSDDDQEDELSDEDLRYAATFKARKTLLTSLQVEALWKVSKVELDRTARRACRWILGHPSLLFPNQPKHPVGSDGTQGWITAKGHVLYTEDARRKVAEAMILLGDIMVQRSKEGTSWKD